MKVVVPIAVLIAEMSGARPFVPGPGAYPPRFRLRAESFQGTDNLLEKRDADECGSQADPLEARLR